MTWGFKLIGTSRHGRMICAVAFVREEKRRPDALRALFAAT